MSEIDINMTVNGRAVTLRVPAHERLLETLRVRLGLTGTKEGCGEGECGSCTVHLDGLPTCSCLVLTWQAEGRDVRTVESIEPARLEPMLKTGATQCGACTPGVVMTADWIRRNPKILGSHGVRELMAGNLCRCTGYDGIVEGVEAMLRADASGGGGRA